MLYFSANIKNLHKCKLHKCIFLREAVLGQLAGAAQAVLFPLFAAEEFDGNDECKPYKAPNESGSDVELPVRDG